MILLDYGLNIGWTSTTTSFIVWTCLDWKPMDISFRRISGCCFPSTFIVPCLVIYIPKKNAESCTPGKYKGKNIVEVYDINMYILYIYIYIYIVYHIILSYKLIPMQRYKLYVFFSLGHIFFFIQPFSLRKSRRSRVRKFDPPRVPRTFSPRTADSEEK